jgi:hypothetical protein
MYIISDQSRVDKVVPRLRPETIYREKIKEDTIRMEEAISEIETSEKEHPKEHNWLDDYMKEIDIRLLEKLNIRVKEAEVESNEKSNNSYEDITVVKLNFGK